MSDKFTPSQHAVSFVKRAMKLAMFRSPRTHHLSRVDARLKMALNVSEAVLCAVYDTITDINEVPTYTREAVIMEILERIASDAALDAHNRQIVEMQRAVAEKIFGSAASPRSGVQKIEVITTERTEEP